MKTKHGEVPANIVHPGFPLFSAFSQAKQIQGYLICYMYTYCDTIHAWQLKNLFVLKCLHGPTKWRTWCTWQALVTCDRTCMMAPIGCFVGIIKKSGYPITAHFKEMLPRFAENILRLPNVATKLKAMSGSRASPWIFFKHEVKISHLGAFWLWRPIFFLANKVPFLLTIFVIVYIQYSFGPSNLQYPRFEGLNWIYCGWNRLHYDRSKQNLWHFSF